MDKDTVKLLKECDSGIKMGVQSIGEVLEFVDSEKLKECLESCKEKHKKLEDEIKEILNASGDEGKEPNPIIRGMSWIKTNAKLVIRESDQTIAELITDGCNMGVKSLHRYLNEYESADEKAKDIAKRLINIEEKLAIDIREFL